jgi:hypothetical protein
MSGKTPQPPDELYGRLKRLGLYGVIARWPELHGEPWLKKLAEIEEFERKRRSLERRIHNAQIGNFKPVADFDWGWPEHVGRELVEKLSPSGSGSRPRRRREQCHFTERPTLQRNHFAAIKPSL